MTKPSEQLHGESATDYDRLPGQRVETGDFWSIWEAARRLLAAQTPPFLLHGLTGGALRRHDAPLVYNDLMEWVAPGLAALDIGVAPTTLPADKAECIALLRACVRGGRTAPLLLFGIGDQEDEPPPDSASSLETAPPPPDGGEAETVTPAEEGIPAGAALLRQRLILEAVQGLDEMRVVDEAGRRQTVGVSWLLAGDAVAVRLTRRQHQGTHRAALRSALRRWAVFASACPERVITPYEEDAPLRRMAAEFLRYAAGARGDRARGMLRRAADRFENAAWEEDIADACDYLRASVCLEFRLTPSELDALISPPTHLLSDVERRELIYLARAGVRDLRVFAARRLVTERRHDDARRTLEQLQYDPDAWVRAVSQQ
jgi:hypothetical protein